MITFSNNQDGRSRRILSWIIVVAILVISFFIISSLYFKKSENSKLIESESKASLEKETIPEQKRVEDENKQINISEIEESEAETPNDELDVLYSNTKGGFSLKPPKGWLKDENYRGDVYVIFRDSQDKSSRVKEFTNNIVVTTPTRISCQDITDYVSRYGEKTVTMLFKDYEKIDAKYVTAGGRNARLLKGTYTGVFNDGKETKLNLTSLITCKDNKIYQINANVYSSDWEKNREVVEASLLTFELE